MSPNHAMDPPARAPATPQVSLVVADSMFSPKTESMASGADLLSEGIVDGIWAEEAVEQAMSEERRKAADAAKRARE